MANLERAPKPVENPVDALAALGLSLAHLAEARGRAQHDVDECTALDPPGARGHIRHIRTVRYLREVLVPLGWSPDDGGNVGAVVSPDGSVSIVVTSGDAATGRHGQNPRTKYPKGEVTWRRVRQNVQLSLFEKDSEEPLVAGPEPEVRQTWVLLQHPAGDVVRADDDAGDEIAQHGSETEAGGQRGGNDGGRQIDKCAEKKIREMHQAAAFAAKPGGKT